MKKIFNGILIGASYVIPGVCSATTAINLGEYNNILEITSNVYKLKILKKHLKLIVSMFIGALLSLLLLSFIFKHIPFVLMSLFLGMNIGIISFEKIDTKHISLNLLGMLFVLFFSIELNINSNVSNLIMIIYGIIVALGFILPGLSGSLMMINFGIYNYLFDLIESLLKLKIIDYQPLIFFFIGLLAGVLVWSKIFNKALKSNNRRFKSYVSGMVLASICLLSYKTFVACLSVFDVLISIIIITMLVSFIIYFRIKKKNEVEYE